MHKKKKQEGGGEVRGWRHTDKRAERERERERDTKRETERERIKG